MHPINYLQLCHLFCCSIVHIHQYNHSSITHHQPNLLHLYGSHENITTTTILIFNFSPNILTNKSCMLIFSLTHHQQNMVSKYFSLILHFLLS
jgi:hypothetical protein